MKDKDEEIIGTCGCGKPLFACYNEKGERTGVTHTVEDEDWHMEYFSPRNFRVIDYPLN